MPIPQRLRRGGSHLSGTGFDPSPAPARAGEAITRTALAWLLGPCAFALATAGIVATLLWRQFRSAASEAIRRSEATLGDEEAGPEVRGRGADDPGCVPGA